MPVVDVAWILIKLLLLLTLCPQGFAVLLHQVSDFTFRNSQIPDLKMMMMEQCFLLS
jgi:hypothetical protein